jgi:(1->4)-alpha-D-glucan 1-alpha-D-glucosylmutase
VWPLDDTALPGLRERLHGYMEKSAREARTYTSWLEPNPEHEQKLKAFIDFLLGDQRFLADFARLREKLEFYGAMNALSQLLLKITCPGVPDFYQGTVPWNFTLVDPDNRRPVEFPKLTDFGAGPQELLANWRDGRIKVFTAECSLAFRRAHEPLFAHGDYIPLNVTGKRADHVIAFARHHEREWSLSIAPRLMTKLSVTVRPPIGIRAWRDTEVVLPQEAASRWRNVFTGRSVTSRDGCLPLHRLLEHFPVALLSARS